MTGQLRPFIAAVMASDPVACNVRPRGHLFSRVTNVSSVTAARRRRRPPSSTLIRNGGGASSLGCGGPHFSHWLKCCTFVPGGRRRSCLVFHDERLAARSQLKSALLCRLVTDGGNQKVHTPTCVFLPAFMMAKNESRIKAFSHPKCVLSSQYLSKGSGAEG